MSARLIRQWSLGFKTTLTQRWFLISLPISFFGAFALCGFLRALLPPNPAMPIALIASSYAIQFTSMAVLLCVLPIDQGGNSGGHFSLWLAVTLLSAAAFGALAIFPGHGEPLRLALSLWALTAGVLGVLAALHALLGQISSPRLARQSLLLIVGVLMTMLFWTRESIQKLTRGPDGPAPASMILADSVMKLSPPVTLAGVWHQQSAAAQSGREGNRFDLVRAPLTYDVWIGSYQILPYPRFWPGRDGGLEASLSAGLILTMLAWSIPLLIMSDMLSLLSLRKQNII